MTQHEPKEPRRAPTREEFAQLVDALADEYRLEEFGALLAAFDALAAERDEWKRRAELEAVSAYDLLARAAKAEAERDAARAEAAEQRANKDAAYSERNQLVALLSTMFPAGRRETDIEGWDPEWSNCVYIDLPTGQASWHYRRDEMPLFVHLDLYSKPWDEHSTGEKYARVALLRAQNVEGGLPPDPRIEASREKP